MPEVQKLEQFDSSRPVYVIKQFFYGVSNASIRYRSDHPLRLDQIPLKYRTKEYIRQGKVRSSIKSMIEPEPESGGLQFDEEKTTTPAETNPLALSDDKDEKGETMPQSTPTTVRRATKARVKEKQAKSGSKE